MRVPVEKTPSANEPIQSKKRRLIRLSPKAFIKLTLLALLVAGVMATYFFFSSIPGRFNILVIGSDQRAEERGRSDVLMVVSLSRRNNQPVSILTIPRDTRVEVPGFGMQKITHAYALGKREDETGILGNRKLTEQTVEAFLGIPIDGTVELTFDSFEQLIDRLGGVTTKSNGKLDGKAALKIVRDRNRDGGDFARTADQREILLGVVSEIRRKGAYSATYEFLHSSSESRIVVSKPRLALFAIMAVFQNGTDFSFANAHNEVVPGTSERIYTPEFQKSLYYWVPDQAKTEKIVQDWFS
ncbi:MAG: LCP family protein [Candidatus Kerfeldbacteria bacterium]|nr:LCP family protein [Candidatus Kerfeldbacteria bacterium]